MIASRYRLFGAALALVLVLGAAPASAHPAASASLVVLDILARDVDAELELPVDQLALAQDEHLGDGHGMFPAREDRLRVYLGEHFRLSASAGRRFAAEFGGFSVHTVDGVPTVHAAAHFHANAGDDLRTLELFDDAILHRVVSHRIFVAVRRDFGRAVFEGPPKIVGVSMFSQKTVLIGREHESTWRGLFATMSLGMRHIAEGVDHLLFLFLLLLVAPLSASARASRRGSLRMDWDGVRAPRSALRSIVTLVTAFTVGHSVSLAAGALGVAHFSPRPIEALIAVSILVTAVHALVPLAPRREAWVAAGFGLIHGLAFAETLTALGFHGGTLAIALLGFNLGIEVMQLAVVLLVVPWILLLCARPAYTPVRIACASAAFIGAGGWLAERTSAHDNPISRTLLAAAPHAWLVIPLLALVAIVARVVRRDDVQHQVGVQAPM